jgi:hypothetical protein
VRDAPRLRLALVALQLATYAATWPLWNERASPPLLALVEVPLSFGPLLAASSLLVLARPRAALAAHAILAVLACAADATRLQPHLLSFPILIAATLPSRDAALVARAHLAILWIAGGLHKLASPDFATTVAPWIAEPGDTVAAVVIAVELTAGIAAVRGGRIAVALAIAVHAGILGVLVSHGENAGVWAWNAAIAIAAPRILLPRAALPASASARAACAALAILPLTAPLGVPPALAGALYAGGLPRTLTCEARGPCATDRELRETTRAFGAPIPTTRWALRAYFDRACAPGDTWLLRANDDTVLDETECPEAEEGRSLAAPAFLHSSTGAFSSSLRTRRR